jgi:hypothetical protein
MGRVSGLADNSGGSSLDSLSIPELEAILSIDPTSIHQAAVKWQNACLQVQNLISGDPNATLKSSTGTCLDDALALLTSWNGQAAAAFKARAQEVRGFGLSVAQRFDVSSTIQGAATGNGYGFNASVDAVARALTDPHNKFDGSEKANQSGVNQPNNGQSAQGSAAEPRGPDLPVAVHHLGR